MKFPVTKLSQTLAQMKSKTRMFVESKNNDNFFKRINFKLGFTFMLYNHPAWPEGLSSGKTLSNNYP